MRTDPPEQQARPALQLGGPGDQSQWIHSVRSQTEALCFCGNFRWIDYPAIAGNLKTSAGS